MFVDSRNPDVVPKECIKDASTSIQLSFKGKRIKCNHISLTKQLHINNTVVIHILDMIKLD